MDVGGGGTNTFLKEPKNKSMPSSPCCPPPHTHTLHTLAFILSLFSEPRCSRPVAADPHSQSRRCALHSFTHRTHACTSGSFRPGRSVTRMESQQQGFCRRFTSTVCVCVWTALPWLLEERTVTQVSRESSNWTLPVLFLSLSVPPSDWSFNQLRLPAPSVSKIVQLTLCSCPRPRVCRNCNYALRRSHPNPKKV